MTKFCAWLLFFVLLGLTAFCISVGEALPSAFFAWSGGLVTYWLVDLRGKRP